MNAHLKNIEEQDWAVFASSWALQPEGTRGLACERKANPTERSLPWAGTKRLAPELFLIVILNFFEESPTNFSEEFPKFSNRIPQNFPTEFPKIFRGIPKIFQRNSPKFSNRIPQNFPTSSIVPPLLPLFPRLGISQPAKRLDEIVHSGYFPSELKGDECSLEEHWGARLGCFCQ